MVWRGFSSCVIYQTCLKAVSEWWNAGKCQLWQEEKAKKKKKTPIGWNIMGNLVEWTDTVDFKTGFLDFALPQVHCPYVTLSLHCALQYPDPGKVEAYHEPMVIGTMLFPDEYTGKMMTLCLVRTFDRWSDKRTFGALQFCLAKCKKKFDHSARQSAEGCRQCLLFQIIRKTMILWQKVVKHQRYFLSGQRPCV